MVPRVHCENQHATGRKRSSERIGAGIGEGLGERRRAMLKPGLSFHAWRSLARDGGRSTAGAADAMVRAIGCAK